MDTFKKSNNLPSLYPKLSDKHSLRHSWECPLITCDDTIALKYTDVQCEFPRLFVENK